MASVRSSRSVLVEVERLEGWLARFAERNGPYVVEHHGEGPNGSLRVTAENGCSAVLTPPLPSRDLPTAASSDQDHGAGLIAAIVTGIDPSAVVGLVLIRRGGYSVGVARSGAVLASKTGTRYVQGRTAAGGWSQQRFARRRANQADALVEETAARAAALFRAEQPSCVQLGGDRALAAATMAEAILSPWSKLPQLPLLTVPDPRFAVLKEAARSALSIRVTVTDPPTPRSAGQ